jgi:hypothetical protein
VRRYPDWEFHTFLLRLDRKFPPEMLDLNEEFVGDAAWLPLREPARDIKPSILRAAWHFGLIDVLPPWVGS